MKSQAEFLSQKYQDAQAEVDNIMKGGPGSGRRPGGAAGKDAENAESKAGNQRAVAYHRERAKDLRSQGKEESATAHDQAAASHQHVLNTQGQAHYHSDSENARQASRSAHAAEARDNARASAK